jgi:hypothetical protein
MGKNKITGRDFMLQSLNQLAPGKPLRRCEQPSQAGEILRRNDKVDVTRDLRKALAPRHNHIPNPGMI